MTRCFYLVATLGATVLWCGCHAGAAATTPTPLNSGVLAPGTSTPAPPAATTYLYTGTVRDGLGRPVAGAIVEAGPDSGTTDSSGRYEFRGTYETAAGRVRPPDGYEPNPKRLYESIPLCSGGQDLTVRRITRVTITAPATVSVGARETVGAEVTFDTGAREYPYIDAFALTSTDASVLKAGGGAPAPFVEGITPGGAQVVATYRGSQSPAVTVQVVPR